ncbi:hypothetical protein A2U01_0085242 [Trifolium medium]|uniref:Uncharacterized protein n=1 Tax=Trifolium medium TaxID=97028 RepID=A0A392TVZ3_9FABA|nr:hypothetical protein [Trifolium medium]
MLMSLLKEGKKQNGEFPIAYL